MSLKTLSITILVLALLAALAFWGKNSGTSQDLDPRTGVSLLEPALVEKAAKLRLSDQGKTLELVKGPDGTWLVPAYYGFPAEFQRIAGFVEEFVKVKVDRFVTANPERLGRFEFKDTQVQLFDATGKELWTITLGKTTENGGRLLRFGTENKAYIARLNTWFDLEAKNWADSSLLNLKPEEISKLELSFPTGESVTLSRAKKEDAFTADKLPAGKKLNADKVSSLLSNLGMIRFTDTVAKDDAKLVAAGAYARTVKVGTFDGKSYDLVLSREPERKVIKAPEKPKDQQESGPSAALAQMKDKLDAAVKPEDAAKQGPAKSLEPVTETIPAGPVFVRIQSSDAKAPVQALMEKRGFQVYEYAFTALPKSPDELYVQAEIPKQEK